jgi:ABC-type transport system involved in cytochrome c biogenesis permease subunit
MTPSQPRSHDSLTSLRLAFSPAVAVLKTLASLRLTVTLLALAVVLVFFGTLAQKTAGLWTVVDRFFWSWIVMIDFQPLLEFGKIFFGLPKDWQAPSSIHFPFPGGKLIGGLMFLNLLAAHAVRFKLTWKRAGIWMAHAGLVMLLVGEAITREFQVEQQMTITEGSASNFAIDSRNYEIAFINQTDPELQRVTVVSAARFRGALARNAIISHPDLPVDLEPLRYLPNAALVSPDNPEAKALGDNLATAQAGLQDVAVSRPEVSGVDNSNKQDFPALYVRFLDKETGKPIGTYLLSLVLNEQPLPVGGTTYKVSLRNIHYYKPFTLRLNHFTYEEYPGTTMAKNYASELTLIDPERGQQRDLVVSMNNPMRYRGETFYQHQFSQTPAGRTTVLQVVRNPGWLLPYIACTLVGLGLLFHFVLGLTRYLLRQKSDSVSSPIETWLLLLAGCTVVALLCRFGLMPRTLDSVLGTIGSGNLLAELIPYLLITAVVPATALFLVIRKPRSASPAFQAQQRPAFERYLPQGVVALGALMLVGAAIPKSNSGSMDLGPAARLPVVDGGRVKPLDTAARVYLRKISAREEFVGSDGRMHPAIEWLMDALATSPQAEEHGPAWKHKVIRIENDQVRALLKLERREGFRYSLEEVCGEHDEKYLTLKRAARRADSELHPREGQQRPENDNEITQFFESSDRDVFANQVLEAFERVDLYRKLCAAGTPLTLPPHDGQPWRSLGDVRQMAFASAFFAKVRSDLLPPQVAKLSLAERLQLPPDIVAFLFEHVADKLPQQELEEFQDSIRDFITMYVASDASAMKFASVIAAYKSGDASRFKTALNSFQEATRGDVSSADLAKGQFEVFLNEFAPTYQIIYLYFIALLLSLAGWVSLGFRPSLADALRKSAFWLLVTTFVVHGFALFARMYLMDRPLVFVTNLYSTAVFIGWAAVGVGLFVERIVPIGLGNIVAAVVGGATAILAHNLAAGSDTLQMMEAVLDTNFWLATHVTTINLGYAATYVAGVIGVVYILLGVFTTALKKPGTAASPEAGSFQGQELGKVLSQVMYGVLCLATLLSFVGTVLGGIWADQSWGRFWGWDPKENGAILIVLWNALILHARWCGLVKDRGIAVLTLFGNMITTWSYFGTNQLGVGLHAYGFNNALATGCMVTWMIHLVLIGIGLIPLRYWRSFSKSEAAKAEAIAAVTPPAPVPSSVTTQGADQPQPTATAAANGTPATNGHAQPNGHPKTGKGKKHKKR